VAAAVLRDEAYDERILELAGRAPATLQRFARDHRTAFGPELHVDPHSNDSNPWQRVRTSRSAAP
jgi:hypothetical protein